MASPFGSGRGSTPFSGAPARSSQEEDDRGVVDFVGNFVGDVKDAVVGIPMGVKTAVTQSPVKTAKQVGGATWQTWSPLFSGDFAKFGKQIYDHPLAPLLDVATVFTLGAGGTVRGAQALSKAGVNSARIDKVASFTSPKTLELNDPTKQARKPQAKHLSERAGRRALQETYLRLEPHLPKWYTRPVEKMRYERAFVSDMAHRVAAKNLMATSALMAGKTLSDPELAPRARQEIAAHMYTNLLRHNDRVDVDTAKGQVKKNKSLGFAVDASLLDRQYNRQLKRALKNEARWDRQRAENAELANELPKIEKELAEANRDLERMYRDGYRVVTPAKMHPTRKEPTERQRMEMEAAPVLDVERRVKDLEARLGKAHKAKAAHDKAVGELEGLKRARMDLEKRSFAEYFQQAGASEEAFEGFVTNFGARAVTRDINRAARDANGNVFVVPFHDARNLGWEAKNSSAAVKWLWRKPTSLWKTIQIGWTPRSITNNAVGNWFLYAIREGDSVEAAKAIHDAIRITKGPEEASRILKAAVPFKRNHWMYREFGDELGNVFGHEMLMDGAQSGSRMKKIAREGLYPFVHKLADEPVRMAAITKYLRTHPEVKALMDKGLDFDKAAARALRTNRALRDQAANHARVVAGDYVSLAPWERTVRDLIPFYLWDRHIVRTTANMALETPGRLALAQRISNLGLEETEELVGRLPEFLRGAIPVGKDGDRADMILTHSLNPFATLGDLAAFVEGLVTGGGTRPGSSVLSQTNPLLTGTVEWATGTSLLTGSPKEGNGGLITSIGAGLASGFPQVRLAQAALTKDTTLTGAGNERLFAADDRSPLTSLLGIPLRDVSLKRAAEMATREAEPKKKKKKRRKTPFQNES